MKKLFLTLLTLVAATSAATAQVEIDNTIRPGGEYHLYNVYYGRVLGGTADDSGPALSVYGTNDADDYVFVAEASTLHSGYYWLRHKKTGKYLQASNADGDTWSVWLAGSLNTQYNSYEWGLTGGTEGYIISNRGEVINTAGNVWLAPDPGHEKEKYVYVYYDKAKIDRAVWQIVSAAAPLDDARLALYVSEVNDLVAQGESIMENPAYQSDDEHYELAAALYNARNAAMSASLDNLEALATAKDALQAAIDNAQDGNYAIWVSGSSFATGDSYTLALKGVTFAPAEGDALPYCTMVVRGSDKTGAVIKLDSRSLTVGDKTFAISQANGEAHDFQFAFDGNAVVVYIDNTQCGHVSIDKVPTMSACGQSEEWTAFGIKALASYRPEIISTAKMVAPGEDVYDSHHKLAATAIKLVGQEKVVSGDIDYHICSEYPLVDSKLDIQGENAWVIFDNVRPSDVIANYLDCITINGATPVIEQMPTYDEEGNEILPDNSGVNCRVAIYLHGTVIIPHTVEYEPFAGYYGTGFSGEKVALGLGDHHELGQFANEMQSFVLKRGYMVTLANNTDGGGYSRVYVADHEDKRISDLPELLKQRVSFIYVRKWNYVSKKGWCGTSSDESMAESGKLLGATWFYSWSASRESQVDMEFVPMQCHRYWPNLDEFYPKANSTACLGLNEPEHNEQHTSNRCSCGGTTDPWTACTMNPSFFHTGLRIGGPSPTDGGWLKEYIGHCDDMSYRCDFVGYHAYWGTYEASDANAWYNRLKSIYDNTKRPIWLTEWNNGASWTKEPWPSDWNDKLDYQRRKIIEICNMLDNADFIERYTIFNLSEDQRKVLKWDNDAEGWWVTPAGEAYRDQHPTHAYNEAMQKVPVGWMPGLKDNLSLTATFDEAAHKLVTTITNPNGDNTAIEQIEYLNDDNEYVPLCQTARCKLDDTGSRSDAVDVATLPKEAFYGAKLVIRLRATTHRGDSATSKRVVLNVPENMRQENGITSAVADYDGARFYSLQGTEVENPQAGNVYIVVKGGHAFKAIYQ